MSRVVSVVLLIVVVLPVFAGLRRGLRRELLNLAGIVAAVAGGILLAKPAGMVFSSIGIMEEVPYLLAFVAGFIATTLAFSLLKAPLVPRAVYLAEWVSGGAVGFAKGLLGAALLVYLVVGIWPRTASAVSESQIGQYVLPLTRVVDRVVEAADIVLPRDLTERIREGYRSLQSVGEELEEAIEKLHDASWQANLPGDHADHTP
jgi:uncharacterized membrane protein required for colicin V production